jgi:hypothetical protein
MGIGILALLGIALIILAIVHVVPFLLGLILGIVLVVIGAGVYYNGRGGPL